MGGHTGWSPREAAPPQGNNDNILPPRRCPGWASQGEGPCHSAKTVRRRPHERPHLLAANRLRRGLLPDAPHLLLKQ